MENFLVVGQENYFVVMAPEHLSPHSSRKVPLTFKEQWILQKMVREAVVCR